MPSPAERYAAAAHRNRRDRSELGRFTAGLDFPLDDFQVHACEAVEEGKGVLVAAPTGAGKTIVGEFAVHLALATGRKAFYTTPIKALSNQKYHDLVRVHGADKVGLLTGDSSVNGEAPVVVMTTEVLRNMMYAGSRTLRGLGYVVMDEVHYLADRFRGAVWEEVIIHLPEHVQVVSLSATVSNAEEFGDWLAEVRGDTRSSSPSTGRCRCAQHMLVGTTHVRPVRRQPGQPRPAGRDPQRRGARRAGTTSRGAAASASRRVRSRRPAAPAPARAAGEVPAAAPAGAASPRGGRPGGGSDPGRGHRASSTATACCPRSPSSSAGSAATAPSASCSPRGIRLIPEVEGDADPAPRRGAGRAPSPTRTSACSATGTSSRGSRRGFAAHHAGMLPTFREIVEELFTDGRIRAVFATETLALGINMPARTVVLERLVKFNGETHADITPAEYTQLTGRAGRRGIDIEGHAVVLDQRGVDPLAVGGLASTRTYPLRSSFRPTYNMAVNLVPQVGRETAREILETSFAQFQADRAVVGMAGTVRRNEKALEGYAEAMTCHLGDFRDYAAIRNSIRDAREGGRPGPARPAAAPRPQSRLEALRLGDIITHPRRAPRRLRGRRPAGNRGGKGSDGASPTVVTEDKQFRRLTLVDVPDPGRARSRT